MSSVKQIDKLQKCDIASVFNRFPTKAACIEYLEEKKWGGKKPKCRHCGEKERLSRVYEYCRWHCNACNKETKVTYGTIFHNSNLALQKWFLLIACVVNEKQARSATTLAADLGISYATIWRACHKIRRAMKKSEDGSLLKGILEMDEAYSGGKSKGKRKYKNKVAYYNKIKRGAGNQQARIVGIKERGKNGRVRSFYVPGSYNKKYVKKMLEENVDIKNSVINTDELKTYRFIGKLTKHNVVTHSKYQFVDRDKYTNNLEAFWKIPKGGIRAVHNYVKEDYLQKYLWEFDFKHNCRNLKRIDRFEKVLDGALVST